MFSLTLVLALTFKLFLNRDHVQRHLDMISRAILTSITSYLYSYIKLSL